MKRIPEPELMDTDEQARAYAAADFSAAHQSYVAWFDELFPERPAKAVVLDLGCGAADVTMRFAKANPGYRFHAVDGSTAMLKYARVALRTRPALAKRIELIRGYIPGVRLPRRSYDVILSSSFLRRRSGKPSGATRNRKRSFSSLTCFGLPLALRPQLWSENTPKTNRRF